jgi:IS605 OrfB family transposase
MYFNSKHQGDVKGRYQYLKRKFKYISRQDNLFVRDVNHVISKKIVSCSNEVIALETLKLGKMKKNAQGKRFKKICSWSPAELQMFFEYKAKDVGKSVAYVDPMYTFQKCSKCGYI